MVFISPDFSEAMKEGRELGYAFALPRLAARLAGRKVRRAEFSRWEAYGLGILVFGISCVFTASLLLPFVRPIVLQCLVLFLLPFAIWVAFLLLFYLNSIVTALLRRLGLYSALTNNPFQHFIITLLTTLLAFLLVRDKTGWIQSLGVFWLALLGLNLLSIAILKLLHEN